MVRYTIHVHTGDCPNAGTDANVSMTIYGKKGNFSLILNREKQDDHERATTYVDFFSILNDLGELEKITIGHDNTGSRPGWFLDKVEIIRDSPHKKWTFPCEQWLAVDEGDGKISRVLPVLKKPRVYNVSVYTGNESYAGTDANVYIKIYGETEESDITWLRNGMDNFEKGAIDVFDIKIEDVGEPKKILIGHDDSGSKSGWFLDKVIIRTSGKEYLFDCQKWLATDEGDGKIKRVLKI